MIRILSFILIVVWIIVMIISKYNLSKSRKIDRSHVAKRYIVRILSVIALSSAIYLILSPTIAGTSVTFNKYIVLIVWILCVIGGIKFLYDILGPVLSKNFVSKLNNNNFAVYLRGFVEEKGHLVNSIENELSIFLKTGIPMFAIGNPYELISCVGSERLYASDDDWEDMVVDLIRKAKLVIIRPSSSDGCLIELGHVNNLHILNKCLFIISSKEDVEILRDHLVLKDYSDLALLEKNIGEGEVLGVKIDITGKFSSFEFSASDENLSHFAILYGIDINSQAKPIHLSWWQHFLDRLAFVLNPLFYSCLFEWGLLKTIIVSTLISSPVVLTQCYANGISVIHLFLMFNVLLLLFIYLLCKTTYISQSRKQFVSANHYMIRVRFLIMFNFIFIVAFALSLLCNPIFRVSFVEVITMSGSLLLQLLKTLWILIMFIWPLLIVFGLMISYFLWRKHHKSK